MTSQKGCEAENTFRAAHEFSCDEFSCDEFDCGWKKYTAANVERREGEYKTK